MDMEIIKITEKEDGSAEIEANFTEDEINFLVEYAVKDILGKYLEELDVRGLDKRDE